MTSLATADDLSEPSVDFFDSLDDSSLLKQRRSGHRQQKEFRRVESYFERAATSRHHTRLFP